MNRILLLGSTGRTGNQVLQLALNAGVKVNVLVRNSNYLKLNHDNLLVFEGDSRVPKDLRIAMEGCEAVVSCLNISRSNDFPWAPLRTPEDFLSMTIKNTISICHELEVKRLISMSAWGVGESRSQIPAWFSWLIDNSNLAAAYLEHERQEALIKNSFLDWTIIRPVLLTNGQKTKCVNICLHNTLPSAKTISRKDIARFIISTMDNQKFIKVTVTVSH